MIQKKQENVIITILLQFIHKTNFDVLLTDDLRLLELFRDVLTTANTVLESSEDLYGELSLQDAQTELKRLDGMYNVIHGFVMLLESDLSEHEISIYNAEYERLLQNMEDIREGLELQASNEFRDTMHKISIGDHSDFKRIA